MALAAALLVIPGIALQGLRWSSLVKGLRSIPRPGMRPQGAVPQRAVQVGDEQPAGEVTAHGAE